MKHLKELDSGAEFFGLGNKNMEEQRCEIIIPIEELSFMGFSDVLKNIFKIRNNFNITQNAIKKINPNIVCLVDYGGFNLKMAKWCKQNGYKVLYYILPKVWAWNEKRANLLKKYCDKLIVIFPFEKDFFYKKKIDVLYFGNPLIEKKLDANFSKKNNAIALLPGSRKQELKYLMPIFIKLASKQNDKLFYIAGIGKLRKYYTNALPQNSKVIYDNFDEVLKQSSYAVVCSGTATLDVAIRNIPQVVVYKTNFINYLLAKLFIKVKYISLPNLIANQPVVKELIQQNCTVKNIELALNAIEKQATNYDEVLTLLGKNNKVSENVAKELFRLTF